MKKITIILSVLFIFTSCIFENECAYAYEFIGSYQCQSNDYEDECLNILTIKEDNTFTHIQNCDDKEYEWSGTWKYNSKTNVITLNYLEETYVSEDITSVAILKNDTCWAQPFYNEFEEYCLKFKENYNDKWETYFWYTKILK